MPIQVPQWTDYLNCGVCCREFGAPPRCPISLSCGHTICRDCLLRLHRKQCPFDQSVIEQEIEDMVVNTALLQLVGVAPPLTPSRPMAVRALAEAEQEAYDAVIKCMEQLAMYLQGTRTNNGTPPIGRLSRPMQRKLVTLLQCALTDGESRARAARAARSLGERMVTELILQLQNPQQLSANLWAAVRARGCQFLGPAMQEEVLKLVLLALEDGSALSRKVLVMFVVQRLEPHFPQASKTSIGHVVQLLYRASCFKVSKRESDSSLMQLREEFRAYDALRREHDAQIVQIATESGLRIAPEQWSALLYGDTLRKSHMQSVIDKLQSPQSFAHSVQELYLALHRGGVGEHITLPHLERLASIDVLADARIPTWQALAEINQSLYEGIQSFFHYQNTFSNNRELSRNGKSNNTDCTPRESYSAVCRRPAKTLRTPTPPRAEQKVEKPEKVYNNSNGSSVYLPSNGHDGPVPFRKLNTISGYSAPPNTPNVKNLEITKAVATRKININFPPETSQEEQMEQMEQYLEETLFKQLQTQELNWPPDVNKEKSTTQAIGHHLQNHTPVPTERNLQQTETENNYEYNSTQGRPVSYNMPYHQGSGYPYVDNVSFRGVAPQMYPVESFNSMVQQRNIPPYNPYGQQLSPNQNDNYQRPPMFYNYPVPGMLPTSPVYPHAMPYFLPGHIPVGLQPNHIMQQPLQQSTQYPLQQSTPHLMQPPPQHLLQQTPQHLLQPPPQIPLPQTTQYPLQQTPPQLLQQPPPQLLQQPPPQLLQQPPPQLLQQPPPQLLQQPPQHSLQPVFHQQHLPPIPPNLQIYNPQVVNVNVNTNDGEYRAVTSQDHHPNMAEQIQVIRPPPGLNFPLDASNSAAPQRPRLEAFCFQQPLEKRDQLDDLAAAADRMFGDMDHLFTDLSLLDNRGSF